MEGMERGRVWGADESQEVIGRECHDGHRCRHAAGAKTGRRDPADKAAAEEQGRDDGHGGVRRHCCAKERQGVERTFPGDDGEGRRRLAR